MDVLADELQKIIAGDVLVDEANIDRFSRDASLLQVRPAVIVAPKNVADIKALVNFVREKNDAGEKLSLTARSGGTGMDGGALSESIVVDFNKYLNQVKEVADTYAVVEPGCFYRDFEKETLKRNRLMPTYPASREICTVGGMVSNNAGGEKTLVYGKTIDFVEKLKVILADGNEYEMRALSRDELEQKLTQDDFEGEMYRKLYEISANNDDVLSFAKPKVSKNSAGYYLWDVWDAEKKVFDMTKLFVGSQGTLGLITEIQFRLVEPQPESQMLIIYLDDLTRVGELVNTILAHKPATFESYDDKTLKLAARFAFAFIKRLGFRNIFTLAINGIPEAFSILRYGFPKLVLQVTFDGTDKKILWNQAVACSEDVKQYAPRYMEVIKSPREADEYWLVRRESFNLLRHKVQGRKTAPFIDDIVVPPSVLPEFFPKLRAILDEYSDVMIDNIAGHIGDGNFHIIPLMDFTDPAAREKIPEIAHKVYDLVLAYGGSITGEHNDGLIRSPFLKQQYGEDVYGLFEKTKRLFDIRNMFNPGKKVGSSMEFVKEHIKKQNI